MTKLKLYLDNCCFNRPFDDQGHQKILLETEAKLYIQRKIKDGIYGLIWSFILDYENSANPDIEASKSIERWQRISQETVLMSSEIRSLAEEMNQLGFGIKDSLHIACALHSKADFFITVDKGILKKKESVKRMVIINPMDFIQIEEDL